VNKKRGRLSGTLKVRRSKALILHWNREELIFENFLLRRRISANALLADLLSELERFKTVDWIKRRFIGKSRVGWNSVLQSLLEQGILVEQHSAADRDEEVLTKNWKWNLPAQYFHFVTKDGTYRFDPEAEQREFQALAKKEQPPSPFKDYPERPFVKLPKKKLAGGDLGEVLLRRRTKRWFVNRQLSLDELSALLFYTWGMTASRKTSIDERILRTSPSGGCRHPIEVYALIHDVSGLNPGIYHYSVRRHGLELLVAKPIGADFVRFCSGQKWVENASVMFVMTALFERTMWRYRFPRAYRVVQIEAGHLGQTLQLAATALRVDSFITAALQDSLIERELGLDGIRESVVYCAAVGKTRNPNRRADIRPGAKLTRSKGRRVPTPE
jgi:SagB-type dehydrogenase family enzyme